MLDHADSTASARQHEVETRHVSDTWKRGSCLSCIFAHPPEDLKKQNKKKGTDGINQRGRVRSSAGCHHDAGIVGWNIPAL